jgi:hypothetical protein
MSGVRALAGAGGKVVEKVWGSTRSDRDGDR